MLALFALCTSPSTRTIAAPVENGAEPGYQPAPHLMTDAATEPASIHMPAMSNLPSYEELQSRVRVLSVALMILLGFATGVCGYLVYQNRKLRRLWVLSHKGSMPMASGVSPDGTLILVPERVEAGQHCSETERVTAGRYLAGRTVKPAARSVPPAASPIPPAARSVPPAASPIPPAADNIRLHELYVEIVRLFEEEKLYLDPDLSAWKLARILGTNKTYVSACISRYKKENFNSLLNFYRIREARKLIEEHVHSTVRMSEIMEASGYRSSTTFYRAFNEFAKMTPKAYLKQKRRTCMDMSP